MKKKQYDFGGWATKNDLLCADGRTIRQDAFKDDDGRTVPLVYQHNHEDPTRVIGHALLENRDDGVYAYCSLNGTSIAQHVKECVRHGDINGLSIYANKLVQRGGDVLHGVIRELSIVLSGANPGAVIEFPMLAHGEESETEAFIWCGEEGIDLMHADPEEDEEEEESEEKPKAKKKEAKPEEDSEDAKTEADESESSDDEEAEPEKAEKRTLPEFIQEKRREMAEHASKEAKPAEEEPEEDEEKKPVKHSDEEDDEALAHAGKDEDDEEEDVDDDTTVQDVLDTLNEKQQQAVDYVLDQLLGGKDLAEGGSGKKGEVTEETVSDVLKTLNKTQKKVVEYLIDQAQEVAASAEEDGGEEESEGSGEAEHSDNEGEEFIMKKNVFDNEAMEQTNDTLTHAQIDTLFKDAKRLGSLRQSVLEHTAEYGIDQIDWLFPEDRATSNTPMFIQRDMGWVRQVMNAVSHTPFSRIKTLFADITEDQARALGYIKGKAKKTEVFKLLKRTTDPQTIYKKQKLDRDDVVDITDFDVVAWMKQEMRIMLDEEIARAILVGDGRAEDSDDHISDAHIHSVFHDDEDLFVIRKQYEAVQGEEKAKTLIKLVRKAWKDYKGSGNATAYMTEDALSDLMLLEDSFGHFLYPTKDVVANVLGVQNIVTVPPMADPSTFRVDEDDDTKGYRPLMIIVNMKDYNVGADKGGSVNMFEDFDIDYNAQKYLIETRCSGALVRPFSAIIIEDPFTIESEDDGN